MKWIGGKFNGTGAELVICCGFVPDAVKVVNLETATPCYMWWNRHMADDSALSIEGVYRDTDGGALLDLTQGEGIQPYYGGDLLTTTTAGTTTYGEGSYLKEDRRDYRFSDTVGIAKHPYVGDAVSEDIVKWTLYSGYGGHFNEDVNGTYIGPGSPIIIDGKMYMISALTAAAGEATNEVTLNVSGVPSGAVQFIGGKYGYKPMVANEVTPAGFRMNEDHVNENNMTCVFEAWTWDSD